jgi:hypothetical protein
MSGLGIFVTKSYDKTPVKQGAKRMATAKVKKDSFRKDPQAFMSKKPKPKAKNIGYTPGVGGGKATKAIEAKSKANTAKRATMSEAARQLSVLKQTAADRKNAEAKRKVQAIKGRRAAAATPSGRGASGAATKKTKPGTVTRGKSNFVLDTLRQAAGRG